MDKDLARMEAGAKRLDKLGHDVMSDDSAEMLYSIALSFWRNKQLEKAEGMYSFLLTIRPRSPKYLMAAARCFYDMGDYRRALSLYSYAGTVGGDTATAVVRAGQCYLMMGEVERAVAMFDYVVRGYKVDATFVDREIFEQAQALKDIMSGDKSILKSNNRKSPNKSSGVKVSKAVSKR